MFFSLDIVLNILILLLEYSIFSVLSEDVDGSLVIFFFLISVSSKLAFVYFDLYLSFTRFS